MIKRLTASPSEPLKTLFRNYTNVTTYVTRHIFPLKKSTNASKLRAFLSASRLQKNLHFKVDVAATSRQKPSREPPASLTSAQREKAVEKREGAWSKPCLPLRMLAEKQAAFQTKDSASPFTQKRACVVPGFTPLFNLLISSNVHSSFLSKKMLPLKENVFHDTYCTYRK